MIVVEALICLLLLASGVVAVTAALGLWRLPDFFLRMHAPALLSTGATWPVTLASVLHFSVSADSLALHTWLVIVLLAVTTPVSTLLLARAALFRARQSGDPVPPPLAEDTPRA